MYVSPPPPIPPHRMRRLGIFVDGENVATAGVGAESWTEAQRTLFAGRAYGPIWSNNVWADCLRRP